MHSKDNVEYGCFMNHRLRCEINNTIFVENVNDFLQAQDLLQQNFFQQSFHHFSNVFLTYKERIYAFAHVNRFVCLALGSLVAKLVQKPS